jgi:hypothetical protein
MEQPDAMQPIDGKKNTAAKHIGRWQEKCIMIRLREAMGLQNTNRARGQQG